VDGLGGCDTPTRRVVLLHQQFPYDPLAGNLPPGAAVLWSALSLVALLGGIALVLLAFGKFDYLGWKASNTRRRRGSCPAPRAEPAGSDECTSSSSRRCSCFRLWSAVRPHTIAPSLATFTGLDFSTFLPSNLLRSWHLQLAIFWIATAYVAGALLLASELGNREPRRQAAFIDALFVALVVVAIGSLLGQWAGTSQWLTAAGGFWFGQQGWEYLELGRAWQIGLAAALVFWFFLLTAQYSARARGPGPPHARGVLPDRSAAAIPVFYLPAMFFGDATHFPSWTRGGFWIIHLWVEGFFEFFVTVLVAVILSGLGHRRAHDRHSRDLSRRGSLFRRRPHRHGPPLVLQRPHSANMAFSAVFSALEVVPLTLLTLDAWDFVKVTRAQRDPSGQAITVPHLWTFYFIMAVGVWNFVGAAFSVSDQPADRELLRGRHDLHGESRPCRDDGRVRDARDRAARVLRAPRVLARGVGTAEADLQGVRFGA
jgi:nitric oxide reductase subunit B